MYVASIHLDFHQELMDAQNTIWSGAFGASITRNLITQSKAMEQKRFDLRPLSSALRNLLLD